MLPVSKSALSAFRVVENLSRNKRGYGYVPHFQDFVALLDVRERRAWEIVKELVEAGWIGWEAIRRKGVRGIAFWPLVRVSKKTQDRLHSCVPRALITGLGGASCTKRISS